MTKRLCIEGAFLPLIAKHNGDLDFALNDDGCNATTFAEHLALRQT